MILNRGFRSSNNLRTHCLSIFYFFLGVVTFYWNTAKEADKYMMGATANWFLTAAVLPWNAQMNMPVKMPMHLVPTLGCIYFAACHVNCLMQAASGKSKAN